MSSLPSMRIILFSTQPSRLVNTVVEMLESLGQQVLLIVTTPGPRTRPNDIYVDIVANARWDLDVLVTSHIKRLPAMLSVLDPDLIFVGGFSWRFPPSLLSLPRLGCVNVHPALLPKYRGPNPLFWQFVNGETQTGLTIHRMDAEFDTGLILAQGAIEIAPDDDVDSLYPKLLPLASSMIPEALAAVAAGAPGTPQPTEGASYAPLCGEAERHLNWTRSASQLRNQIRGWGREGVLAEVDGKTIVVRRARIVSASAALASSKPGILLERSASGLLVQTGQGALLIEDFAYLNT